MSESPAKIRLVRCPKCENLLPEVTDYQVYQCGACGAVLRGKLSSFSLFLFDCVQETWYGVWMCGYCWWVDVEMNWVWFILWKRCEILNFVWRFLIGFGENMNLVFLGTNTSLAPIHNLRCQPSIMILTLSYPTMETLELSQVWTWDHDQINAILWNI